MKLLTILGIAVGGSLIAVIILFIVKGIDSKQGEAPGLINLQLSACSAKPNCVSSEAGTPGDKKTAPFALTAGQIEQDWDRLQRVIRDHGGALIRVEPEYLAATFTSSLFGFVDDLEARLDKPNNVIQIRSASRVGTSDLGANRTRVELLRQRYVAKP
ncbi:MAG: hypothetical protein ACI9W6_002024 [Motiliproteus sp.]|jgi:uncharacterized protein (DUF1499 family)